MPSDRGKYTGIVKKNLRSHCHHLESFFGQLHPLRWYFSTVSVNTSVILTSIIVICASVFAALSSVVESQLSIPPTATTTTSTNITIVISFPWSSASSRSPSISSGGEDVGVVGKTGGMEAKKQQWREKRR